MNACARSLFVALVAALLAVPSSVEACAVAPPRGATVDVASESAVIVWDSKSKTQHFIRRATFTAHAPGSVPVKDFGFLVPTPAVPELAEVPDAAFAELAKITAPKTVTERRPSDAGGGCGCAAKRAEFAASAGKADVEVLAEKQVAGYDAKVLKADDADALTRWLNDRGYEVRPALTRWLKPYLEKKWVVTAFKIATGPDATASQAVGSAAVRMSFAAETPFFPYSEPDDMRAAKTPRLLRVFCIADQKMSGTVGGAAWDGRTVWAGRPGAEGWKAAAAQLNVPGWQPTETTWLTEFEDRSSPRAGDADLEFRPAGDEAPVQRPPHVIYAARPDAGAKPALALLGAAVVGVYLARFLGRRA